MTRPTLLSNDPAKPYNVAIPAEKPGGAPTYPLRNLVGGMRIVHVLPWLAETSLEDVVELWQYVRNKQRKEVEG